MQREIETAEQSLAETEDRLRLDAKTLRIALELADDVAAFYATADDQTRRGYNQAFFKKLKIRPEWDNEKDELRVRVVDAVLTDPYAVLLADGLTKEVLAEAERIRDTAAKAEGDPVEPPSAAGVSIFETLAGLMRRYSNPEVKARLARLDLG